MHGTVNFALVGLLSLTVSGCVSQQLNQRSNALEYLYSAGAEARPAATIEIARPVRVGIAFAPSAEVKAETFSTEQKQALLARVAKKFRDRKGIDAIEIIPANYLSPRGGFEELDRLSVSFRVNQFVLISYDQVQFTESSALSLTYWVTYGAGAYVIKGEKNETRTLMDAVVYDIASRTMLFHAVGQSSIKGSSTLMGMSKALRERSIQGFNAATDDLVVNLEASIEAFVATMKDGTVTVAPTPALPAWDSARHKPVTGGE